jgi:hypothetical protein
MIDIQNLTYRQKVGLAILGGVSIVYTGIFTLAGHKRQVYYTPTPQAQVSPQTTTTVQTTEGWKPFQCNILGQTQPYKYIPQARVAPDIYTQRKGNKVTYFIMTPSNPTIETATPITYDISVAICGFPRNQ